MVVVLRDGCVLLELELDDAELDEADELAAEEAGAELVVLVVVAAGAHDSDSETIGSETGRLILDSGVPGGTLTVNDCVSPPASVTVTVHSSADASGSDPSASAVLTDATAIINLAVLSTVENLLPQLSCATPSIASYLVPACIATLNRRGLGVVLLGARQA